MLPLEGVRVLDLSSYMAGPLCTWLLADMGAEVIRVESCRRPEPLRIAARGVYPNGEPGERPWNRSGMVNARYRGKLGITLDIASPKGREIFLRLVAVSHVVVENFQTDVLKKLGVEYEVLAQVNPRIVLLSLSSQGLSGPESSYRSFGPTLEQIGGLLSITGYGPDEPPYLSTLAFPDVLAAVLGAGLVVAALRQVGMREHGLHIDLSQRELTTNVIGEAVMDYTMNKRGWRPIGNRDFFMAPHGCYRCRGEDSWIAIAVYTDEQWRRLCEVMNMPEMSTDPRFQDAVNRYRHQDEIDAIITNWTIAHEQNELQETLGQAGIPAGAVLDARGIYSNRHLKERGFFDQVTHPEAGTHLYPGRPARLSAAPERNLGPAPCLGEHNEYVLGEILGLSKDEIIALEAEGIIGKTPTPDALKLR